MSFFLDESIEPPRHVRITADSQSNTLTISWVRPSSINVIRGYRIFLDGYRVLNIKNSLGKIRQCSIFFYYAIYFHIR